MENISKCLSRYKDPRYLKKVSEDTYHVWGEDDIGLIWVDFENESIIKCIDFSGGPKICTNNPESLEVFGIKNTIIESIENITTEEGNMIFECKIKK